MITNIAYVIGGIREDIQSINSLKELGHRVQDTYDLLIRDGYTSQRATKVALAGNIAYCVLGKLTIGLMDELYKLHKDEESKRLPPPQR